MNAEPFWKVDDLTLRLGGRPVLKNVSLQLRKGEILAVVGPSGAGKTTLLRALDLLERPDSGRIEFLGEAWDLRAAGGASAQAYRRRTGFVFQNHALFLNRTALGNVVEALRFGHGMPKKEAETRARIALASVGLADLADRYPNELSGGQQQRAAIARAVAPDPELIFLDEPTSALDPGHRRELLQLLERIAAEGRTMLIVTHDIAFASQIATRAALFDEGSVVEEAPADVFFSNPRHPRTRAFLANEAAMSGLDLA